MPGTSCSLLRNVVRGLITGGGDLNRGDIGQRGVSLGAAGFCGVGDLISGSDIDGCIWGMLVVESAL
jgi:hypothetical protein